MAIHLFNVNLVNKLRLIIFIAFCLCFSMFLLNSFLYKQNRLDYQISQYVHLSPHKIKSFKVILYWNTYFGRDIMYQIKASLRDHNTENLLIRPNLCYQQYPNCFITSNHMYMNVSKAFIFHWRDFDLYNLPPVRKDQLWILYNLEAPPNTKKLPDSNMTFNLTATYRHDSDIPITYGKIVARPKPQNIDLKKTIDLSFKIKPIVWFVSNCNTQSQRENYVNNLSKMIQIDIYGKCGKNDCPLWKQDECYRKAAKEYLFYLSFENSICKDYVTEKLFNVMNYNIVPIVFGGANYSALMPPGSYIDANKMSPESLAKLIIKISSNRKLYLNYFRWRETHYVDITPNYNSVLFCKLCEKLEQKIINEKSKTWTQINNWYFDGACQNPNIVSQ